MRQHWHTLNVNSQIVALMLLALLGMAGCDLLPDSGSGQAGATAAATPIPVVASAHRDPLYEGFCEEASTEYSPELLSEANAFVAKGLVAAVRDDSDPVSFTMTYIDKDPLDAQSSPVSVTLSATPAYPALPTLDPLPTPTGQPFHDAQLKLQVQQANQKKIDAYNAAVTQVKAQIASVRAIASQTATQLTTVQPPSNEVNDAPSVWACVDEMAQRFSQFTGIKMLTMATGADEKTWKDELPTSDLAGLKGAVVNVIFYDCSSEIASFCEFKQKTWNDVFTSVGVAKVHWLDPGATQAADPAMLFDPTR